MTNDLGKATIYRRGDFFGVIGKTEVRACEVERGSYAQYKNSITVRFVKKGARKTLGFRETYEPYLLILAGHGHPDPAGMFDGGEADRRTPGVTSQKAKYSACSDGYADDFNAMIEKYLDEGGGKILFDARGEHIS
jgi:hypothetical protein